MNRSILIVICDFLLLSLLMFSSVDLNKVKVTEKGKTTAQGMKLEISTNQPPDAGKDLAAVMKLALDDERRNREQLMSELTRSRAAVTDRTRQAQLFQQQLETKDQEARRLQQEQTRLGQEQDRLQQEQARLQQEQANLQHQYAAAQTNIQTLSQQLQGTSADALLSKEKLAAMEAEAKKRAEQAAALQQQLAHLAQSNQLVLNEKQQLATQLQVAEVEKRHATEQVVKMTEEVKVERAEKAKLAEGVKALASKSSELTQEIRENRPLASNTIFNEFATNRVQARVNASRSGAFGNEVLKREEIQSVLVSDGSNIFALCHVQNTPLAFSSPGTTWEGLTGSLAHDLKQIPIRSLSFCWPDPRVVLFPVSAADARLLGSKVYRTSSDPFKFQDCVLVGTQEAYYGECKFEIDVSAPDYVRLDRSVLKGLFGKFNPSRGDLVLSRTGELLGIMANDTYCMMIRRFDASATFRFGPDVRAQRTGETLSALHTQVAQLPAKLQ